MTEALNVFLNGTAGVIVGMGALYLAIKLLALLGREPSASKVEE